MKKTLLIAITAAIALAAVWLHFQRGEVAPMDTAAVEEGMPADQAASDAETSAAAIDPSGAAQPSTPPVDSAAEAPIDTALLEPTADDRMLGEASAPVTIVEYASLSCSHCADFHTKTLPALKERFIDTGKARWIFRDYPLNAPALKAAMLTRCVSADKYFPLLDALFSQQNQWVITGDSTSEIAKIANFSGISTEEFTKCTNDKELEARIVQGYQQADQRLSVKSTPTLFINGQRVVGALDIDSLALIIEPLAGDAPAPAVVEPAPDAAPAGTDPAAAPSEAPTPASPDGATAPEADPAAAEPTAEADPAAAQPDAGPAGDPHPEGQQQSE